MAWTQVAWSQVLCGRELRWHHSCSTRPSPSQRPLSGHVTPHEGLRWQEIGLSRALEPIPGRSGQQGSAPTSPPTQWCEHRRAQPERTRGPPGQHAWSTGKTALLVRVPAPCGASRRAYLAEFWGCARGRSGRRVPGCAPRGGGRCREGTARRHAALAVVRQMPAHTNSREGIGDGGAGRNLTWLYAD
jgi:hypothetical protein